MHCPAGLPGWTALPPRPAPRAPLRPRWMPRRSTSPRSGPPRSPRPTRPHRAWTPHRLPRWLIPRRRTPPRYPIEPLRQAACRETLGWNVFRNPPPAPESLRRPPGQTVRRPMTVPQLTARPLTKQRAWASHREQAQTAPHSAVRQRDPPPHAGPPEAPLQAAPRGWARLGAGRPAGRPRTAGRAVANEVVAQAASAELGSRAGPCLAERKARQAPAVEPVGNSRAQGWRVGAAGPVASWKSALGGPPWRTTRRNRSGPQDVSPSRRREQRP